MSKLKIIASESGIGIWISGPRDVQDGGDARPSQFPSGGGALGSERDLREVWCFQPPWRPKDYSFLGFRAPRIGTESRLRTLWLVWHPWTAWPPHCFFCNKKSFISGVFLYKTWLSKRLNRFSSENNLFFMKEKFDKSKAIVFCFKHIKPVRRL